MSPEAPNLELIFTEKSGIRVQCHSLNVYSWLELLILRPIITPLLPNPYPSSPRQISPCIAYCQPHSMSNQQNVPLTTPPPPPPTPAVENKTLTSKTLVSCSTLYQHNNNIIAVAIFRSYYIYARKNVTTVQSFPDIDILLLSQAESHQHSSCSVCIILIITITDQSLYYIYIYIFIYLVST